LSSREHPIALGVRDKGFVVMTLRAANEVRDDAPYFEDIGEDEPDQEMLELAEALIDKKSGRFDPSEFRDNYQEALLELVKAKIKGQEPVIAKAPERGKVVNLMDALKRSLDEGEARKPPAKSQPRKAPAAKQPARSGGAKKKQAKAS
jgi:DNA end-binding protein Ku